MITPNYRRFILSNLFLDNYKGKQPNWGPLGYVTYKSRYARLKDDGKTEEFWETLKRVVEGVFNTQKKHCSNLGLEWDNAKAQKTAQEMYDAMWNFKFLPPGRGLWMAGTDYVENRTSMSMFNCSFVSTEDLDRRGARPFAFIMDGLMLGVGMGFDTKGENSITIKEPAFSDSTHIIADSREGWVESLEILLNGYFSGSKVPVFDYSALRGKGEPLKGFGGVSSGPQPLITLHEEIKDLLEPKIGNFITSAEIVDIENLISKCVIAGNIRRSAAIALGRKDDKEFLELKHDQEKLVSHRYASNNSILADVGMDYSVPAENTIKQGEPGYIWLDNMRTKGRFKDENASFDNVGGVNPCLSGDTRLLTNEGYIPIGNLEDTSVTLIDNKGNQATGKVWKTGTRDTVFVTLSTGAKIQCTPDHIFMTKDGRSVRALFLEGETLSTYDGTNCKEKYIMVTSVYPAGKTEVYDFSIDTEGHWGICEDVVVHNCSEQQLESFEACNLTELFPVNHDNFEEYKRTIKLAYLYAKTITLMNTHWPETNAIMLKNRRIGLSQTGIQQARIKHGTRELLNWCDEGYKYVQKLDEKYSDWLCIPRSKRTTTVKPSGTVSLLPGVTPGIHYDESEYYIRRIRFEDISPLLPAIEKAGYKIEQDVYNKTSKVVEFPVKADFFERSKYEVSMWEQLEFAAKYQHYWSDNAVSITVTFKPEEARDIKNALELYEDRLKVVSFLPLGDHGYKQAPYEAITEEQYKEMSKGLKKLNFKNITSQAQGEKFCDGDQCEV